MRPRIKTSHSATTEAPMRFFSRLGMATFIGIIGLTFPYAVSSRMAEPMPTISVRVYNYTEASPTLLAEAKQEAGRILKQAGLQIVWMGCWGRETGTVGADSCGKPLETSEIVLRIFSESIENRFQTTVFGFATHPVLATVYYDYAVLRAKKDAAESEAPIILGCVIAHEIGHLLLGPNGHSVEGIMQARWEPKQIRQATMGCLLFTPAQSKLMRVQVQARNKKDVDPSAS